ncbi:MAG: 23S rRNA (adenine(2503)-C(2))-methyltransferase RlmN [Treponema sp.]|nr:23S rRNA (adenine(2503)-C(2))-methyltransferase RlmN [Treponema sp.]
MEHKPALAGLPAEELARLLKAYPPFRSRQIHQWICGGAAAFDEMINLPAALRKDLAEQYDLIPGAASSRREDADGTAKLGITFADGAAVEAVILSDGEGRKTACLSTQAGCPAGCVFCKTGSLGFKRNLSAAEIAGQFLHLRKMAPGISHIVIMGMGEPLLNLEELRSALGFFMENGGLNISKRRITISSCGIEKGILDLAEYGPDARFALSLTTARQELRQRLMPISRENPLPKIRDALVKYQKTRKQRITLEMVLLGGINSSARDAEAAAEFVRSGAGLDAVINLIPWNPVAGLEFEGRALRAPTPRETADFTAALENRGLKVTRRFRKGSSICGACGQLGALSEAPHFG